MSLRIAIPRLTPDYSLTAAHSERTYSAKVMTEVRSLGTYNNYSGSGNPHGL
jgi:hypothetical protein